MPDQCGMNASALSPRDFERQVMEAIRDFEPRIQRNLLAVKVLPESTERIAVTFEVTGELWAQPIPDRLYIKTELDLETGECIISERPGG